jgi:integration host factor subunit beta
VCQELGWDFVIQRLFLEPYSIESKIIKIQAKWCSDMTKSELIERITDHQEQLSVKDVELAVKSMLEHMSQVLASGERIEIRGFGSFSLHYREPRTGRNPKTGELVQLEGKYVPHFKPGKEMRDRVNESIHKETAMA